MNKTDSNHWKTKPTDRFILRWIKVHLAARLTPEFARIGWMRPWMVTVSSAALGVLAGVAFACGWGLIAGVIAAVSQVLDGVDGQLARKTNRVSGYGAFLDSVLDRYADGAMVIGLAVYTIRSPGPMPMWGILFVGGLALIGCNLISYAKARADCLKIPLGKPTLASKGTRMTLMVLAGLLSPIGPAIPLFVLCYLALHPNCVVGKYIFMANRSNRP